MAIYAAPNKRVRQGAAAGCALYTLRGGAAAGTCEHWLASMTIYAAHNKRGQRRGGKVPQPGARSTPFGVARRLALAGIGWSAKPFTQCINKATPPFTRRTTSAVSAANECEGITCGSK